MFVGFSISKVESARQVPLEDLAKYRNINVNYDINLRNPSIARGPGGEVLRVEFTVAINYLNPSIGFIRFEGFCDHAGGDNEKVRKEWDAGHADPAIQNEIANNMVARIIPLAMLLSQNLSLPPVMPLPVINFQQAQQPGPATGDKFDQYHA